MRINGFNESVLKERQYVVERMTLIQRKIDQLRSKQREDIPALQRKLEIKTEAIFSQLSAYVYSPEFRLTFTTWKEWDVPADGETWKSTKQNISSVIHRRMEKSLAKWNEDNGIHAKVHDELVEDFRVKFSLAESELRDIEKSIHDDDSSSQSDVSNGQHNLTVGKKFLLGATSPLWITFGVASWFERIPIIDSIFGRVRFDQYRKNRAGYLAERSNEFLKCVTDETLGAFVKQQMHLAEAMLRQFALRIPSLLEANRKMVLELVNETRSKDEVWRSNYPILKKSLDVQEKLLLFGVSIWPETVNSCRLIWCEEENSCVGVGEFASTYIGTLAKSGGDSDSQDRMPSSFVAVKLFSKPFDSVNAMNFLNEEGKLRALSHSHVVKFYGSMVLTDGISTQNSRVLVVMDIYPSNLRKIIFDHGYESPSYPGDCRQAVKRFLSWAAQIADGLTYIHSQKLIHRHMKLENILVAADERVKITDTGIRGRNDISVNSMIYAAPEVLQTAKFSPPADVYSFGVILWEMWYGSRAFEEILPLSKSDFLERILHGCRPVLRDYTTGLQTVHSLMCACWAENKDQRLSASQCYSSLERFSQHCF